MRSATNSRNDLMMTGQVAKLGHEDVRDLASNYASLKPGVPATLSRIRVARSFIQR